MQKNTNTNRLAPVVFGELLSKAVLIRYRNSIWDTNPTLVTRENISFGANTSALHYGQAIFEGMRASLLPTGDIGVFRLNEHWARFNRSAKRMGMPQVSFSLFYSSLMLLFQGEAREMLTSGKTKTIYIRPSMINCEETFSPNKTDEYALSFTMAPLENNLSNENSCLLNQEFSRADVGGVGMAKTAGNYGRVVNCERFAITNNFNNVLFAGKTLQEFGTMSLFYLKDGVLFTPSLDNGLILDGITRKSIISLARQRGIETKVGNIETSDFKKNITNGKISQIFGTGTASILIPFNQIGFKFKHDIVRYSLPNNKTENIVADLYNDMLNVYSGRSFVNWVTKIPLIAETVI